jgi:hypothetical protein
MRYGFMLYKSEEAVDLARLRVNVHVEVPRRRGQAGNRLDISGKSVPIIPWSANSPTALGTLDGEQGKKLTGILRQRPSSHPGLGQ